VFVVAVAGPLTCSSLCVVITPARTLIPLLSTFQVPTHGIDSNENPNNLTNQAEYNLLCPKGEVSPFRPNNTDSEARWELEREVHWQASRHHLLLEFAVSPSTTSCRQHAL